MAPDFTLPHLNGDIVRLYDQFGKGPIYITFWATWCKPCLEEMKIIQGIYEKYESRGLRVLAINNEGPKAMSKIRSFVKSNSWTFDILIDKDGEVFRKKYKGFAQPYSVLTDSDGKILFSSIGFKPGDEVKIENLIVANLIAIDTSKAGTEQ
jgi:peroxiredoxin